MAEKSSTPNEFEIRARADKVHKLHRFLDSLGISAEEAASMSIERWEMAAIGAKVKPPSARSRGLVVRLLAKELIDVREFARRGFAA